MLVKIIILLSIVFVKSIFALFETAITYLNRAKFNQLSKNCKLKNRKKVLLVKTFIDDKIKTFSSTRIGLTLSEQLVSVFAAEAFVSKMIARFELWGINAKLSYISSLILITLILSYLTIVFGELLPKKIAKNYPERTAYRYVYLFAILSKIMVPFEFVLDSSVKLYSKIFRIKEEKGEKLTEKELRLIIAESTDQGLFDKEEKRLLINAIRYDRTKVHEIMKSKEDIVMLNIDSSKEKVVDVIKKYRFTRIPIYSQGKDNIVGVVNLKDLFLSSLENGEVEINLKDNLREILFIARNEKIDEVFKKMQQSNIQIAIVKDKNGNIEGLITLEDILEKLVGNIEDEFAK